MSWDLFRKEVVCPVCGTQYEYVVEHPPIPMIVRGFYNDEGRPVGDDCPVCWTTLPVPEEEVKVSKSLREEVGQTIVEYAMIVAVLAVLAIPGIFVMTYTVQQLFVQTAKQIAPPPPAKP